MRGPAITIKGRIVEPSPQRDVPGPGAYDVKLPGSPGVTMKGRFSDASPSFTPGPGAYDIPASGQGPAPKRRALPSLLLLLLLPLPLPLLLPLHPLSRDVSPTALITAWLPIHRSRAAQWAARRLWYTLCSTARAFVYRHLLCPEAAM